MNKAVGFILRMISLIMIGLIAMSRSMGVPVWGSVLMLIVSFVCFFLSTKALK